MIGNQFVTKEPICGRHGANCGNKKDIFFLMAVLTDKDPLNFFTRRFLFPISLFVPDLYLIFKFRIVLHSDFDLPFTPERSVAMVRVRQDPHNVLDVVTLRNLDTEIINPIFRLRRKNESVQSNFSHLKC